MGGHPLGILPGFLQSPAEPYGTPNELWSSARLLPTIALTKGYRIYSGVSPI